MYKLLLCQRYLRTRFIALASIISVMLGVATMIVVNSVMAGFATEMRTRIHGILADIVIESGTLDGAFNAERHMQKIEEVAGEHIAAMSPTVEIYGMLSFQYVGEWFHKPVTIIGIDPVSKSKVSDLSQHLMNYQTVKSKSGNVERAALRMLDQVPDWELEPEFREHRRMRAQQRRMLHLDEAGDESGPFGPTAAPKNATPELVDAEAKPKDNGDAVLPDAPASDNSDDLLNALDAHQIAKQSDAPEVDPADPLSARVYLGAGLVSFLYEERESKEVRMQYMVQPGDDVKLSTVTAGRPPDAIHFNATAVDVFKSGMSEYDGNLVFMNLDQLQVLRGMYDPSSGQIDPKTGKVDPATCARAFTTIQIRLKDYRHARTVVERLKGAFPPGLYSVRTWEEKQGPLLEAVAVESAILNVLLFLIIAVAGFGILAIFFMIVVEKTRDIGILKALGASSNGIASIFLTYGLGLGLVGSCVGTVAGLVFVWNINTIEKWLSWLTGIEVFNDRIYYFQEIPTHIEPMMVFWVALGAMSIAVLASVLPARRAARLHPVQALRYE
jgi:lipoprotein-releasing system permease protein